MTSERESTPDKAEPAAPEAEAIHDVEETTCCIVGGGPAGVMLSLFLARQNIPVVLLEAHQDFERDFRGDTIHASVMEILDQLGLAERVLEMAHGRVHQLIVHTASGPFMLDDLSRLPTRFPFATMIAQAKFLQFITEEARRSPAFHLHFGANVQRLVEEEGVVRGVRYRGTDGAWHEVRALLTVGADGRFSKVRAAAGLEQLQTAPPIDVLWFRLPRRPEDPTNPGSGYVGAGRILILFQRPSQWQIGYVFPKGGYQQLRSAGLDVLRRSVAELVPWLGDRVDQLNDWRQVALLPIQSGRLPQWYKPGLLFIGDTAHTMSPMCAVGINYAIQDAVVAANELSGPLKAGRVEVHHLAAVQKLRERPTKIIQAIQAFVQKRLLASMADAHAKPFSPSFPARLLRRLPIIRDIPARLINLGFRRVRLNDTVAAPAVSKQTELVR
jgi:2-polyprenyl-6-methoxyphenol hydroxylase-like FAD-dependent oxidoreductase